MKKFIIAIIVFPILLISGYGFGNTKFNKIQNFSDLENSSIIDLEFSQDGNTNGAIIDTDGDQKGDSLYMWGQNNNYQVGDETSIDKFSPVEIEPQGQTNWGGNLIDLEIAQLFSGVTVDTNNDGSADTLYMWGSNYRGEIGNGEVDGNITSPEVITPNGQNDWDGNIINLSLMYGNTAISIDTNNDGYGDTVYGWGENSNYEISPKDDATILNPEIIIPENGDWGGNIIDLKLGSKFGGVTVDTDADRFADTLYMWGDNAYGELTKEISSDDDYIQYPTIINPTTGNWNGNIITLSLGFYNSAVLIDTDLDGLGDTIYGWGQNNYGQIGDGTQIIRYSPVLVSPTGGDWGGNILQFEKGSYTSGLIVDSDFDGLGDLLYMWGDNSNGQIGVGTTNNVSTPTIVYPENQSSWSGPIYSLSNGFSSTGVIIDSNDDGIVDSFYAAGSDSYGQIGNGSNDDNSDQLYFINVYSSNDDISIASLDFIYDNDQLYIDLKLNDYNNSINIDPTVLLIDSNDITYTTTFISSNSDIPNDEYYYRVNGIERGTNYYFSEIIINNVSTLLDEEQFTTDYIISSYSVNSVTEQSAIINFNLNNNNNVTFSDYTSDQLKIKINYTDLDLSNYYSKEASINTLKEYELTDLNAETNYQIDSIQYFYENGSYKYQINQSATIFKTQSIQPIIQTSTSLVIDETITSNSFQYTIEIDNLIPNSDNTNFINYDIYDGLWLIDQEGYNYRSTFIAKEFYKDSDYSNAYDYIITYEVDGLSPGEYLFDGISFDQPLNFANSNIVTYDIFILDPPMDVIIPDDGYSDPVILTSTYSVSSVGPTSFQYRISLDDLIQTGNVGSEPAFANFDQTDGLYLKDSNQNTYHSEYVGATAVDQGNGTAVGSKQYQFTFQVSDLLPDTDYQFNGISPNQNGPYQAIENGDIHTDSMDDDCCFPFWWWVSLIIILLLILLLLILLLFKGNSSKEKIKRKETIEVNQQENKTVAPNNVEQNNVAAPVAVKQNKSPARRRTYKKNDDTKKLTEEIAELSKIIQKIDQENKDIKINIQGQGINQEGNVQQKRKKVNKKVDQTKELKDEITELSKMVQELNNSKPAKKSRRRNNKTDKLSKEITELSKVVQKINQENKGIKKDIKEISKKKK